MYFFGLHMERKFFIRNSYSIYQVALCGIHSDLKYSYIRRLIPPLIYSAVYSDVSCNLFIHLYTTLIEPVFELY
jgi:hypothetical protein